MMSHILFSVTLVTLLLAAASSAKGQTSGVRNQSTPAGQFAASPRLQRIVDDAARGAVEKFKDRGLSEKNLAVTLVDLTDPRHVERASFRGGEQIYPASVVKLFYLVAAHRWIEDGRLKETEEFDRAMHDMIVDSLNDPAQFILDALTGVSNGVELPPEEMKVWAEKRNAVNRYFASLGYANINVNQKPWCEGPYGRERQFYGPNFANRNMLTTDATARLLVEIATGRAPLVEGRLDEHRAARRRIRRAARRTPLGPRHLHDRRCQGARHHPDDCAVGD